MGIFRDMFPEAAREAMHFLEVTYAFREVEMRVIEEDGTAQVLGSVTYAEKHFGFKLGAFLAEALPCFDIYEAHLNKGKTPACPRQSLHPNPTQAVVVLRVGAAIEGAN